MKLFGPLDTEKNQSFYSRIIQGKHINYVWGKEKRFTPERTITSRSIAKFFKPKLDENVLRSDRVLDVGCGSGVFFPIVAPICSEIIGIDVSHDMLQQCRLNMEKLSINNFYLFHASSDNLPFLKESFDVIYMVDVIHHVASVKKTIEEVCRVLKPDGRVIVFEPNKLNALLATLCLLDRNEWGALRLGSKRQYRKVFDGLLRIDEIEYNGTIIGPDVRLNCLIADFLDLPCVKPFFGWQSPKIYIRLTKIDV